MIRIAAHIPNPHDGTAYYRATGPLAHLMLRGPIDLEYTEVREWSEPAVKKFDLAFFQRPATKGELEAIRICKRLGVPVIVDYDDLLFDIPADNPAYRLYMNKETQETIINIMREADCLWVSTSELKRCIQIKHASLNDRVYVVPNALDDFRLVRAKRALPPAIQQRQPAVLWRGSATHERDVMDFTPEIGDVAEACPKKTFVFVGYNPWFLTERMRPKQAICSGAMPIGEFMDFMYATAAQVGIVPLHDSRFNRCKSNIAWLEMSWAGGVVLAPDWEEWRQPGIVTYENAQDFKAGLMALCQMEPEKLIEMHKMSWQHICKHFLLSKTNEIRSKTLMATLLGKDWPEGWKRLADPDEEVMELQ